MDQYQFYCFGGCHVTGYLVGEENAFSSIVRSSLVDQGREVSMETVDLLPVHHPERIERFFKERTPDLVILQVGNFEMIPSAQNRLKRIARSLFGVRFHSGEDRHIRPILKEAPFSPKGTDRIRILQRAILHVLTGGHLVGWSDFRANINTFFNVVPSPTHSTIMVLSPLPVYDPIWNWYRRKGGEIIAAEAKKRGWTYIDVHQAFGASAAERSHYLIDIQHLNRAGHQRVAELIIDTLQSLHTVPRST